MRTQKPGLGETVIGTRSDRLSTLETTKRDPSSTEFRGKLAEDPLPDTRLSKLVELLETAPISSVHDWALKFNLSDSHLQHLFKQATGVGLGRALSEKRLLRAAQLLSKTSMSIKEVAHAVGYEHTSSFTRAFARRFEKAPSDYRRKNAA